MKKLSVGLFYILALNLTSASVCENHLLEKNYNRERIWENMAAVHATNFISTDGKIELEKGVSGGKRKTIHFSLGELVRDYPGHSRNVSWEKRFFAVVVPLGSLKKQLVNVNCYDSFIIGEFDIPDNAIVVSREDKVHLLPKNLRIFSFDQNQKSLRTAAEEAISLSGLWKVQMFEGYDGKISTKEAMYARAVMNGKNINSPIFFKEILDEVEGLSFGTHIRSANEGLAWRFGVLDQSLQVAIIKLHSLKTGELKIFKEYILYQIDELINLYLKTKQGRSIQKYLSKLREDNLQWLSVIDTEIYAREKYNISLLYQSRFFFKNRTDKKKMKNKVDELALDRTENLKRITSSDSNLKSYAEKDWAHLLLAMSEKKAVDFLRSNSTYLQSDFNYDVFSKEHRKVGL